MSQIRITARDLGAEEAIAKKLRKLQRRDALMRSAGLLGERETKLNFAMEKSPDDDPWADLAPSTIARKGSSAILQDKGDLKGGIAMTSANKDQAIVQTTVSAEIGLYHQKGTTRKGSEESEATVKMPARPYIGVGNRLKSKIQILVNNWWGE